MDVDGQVEVPGQLELHLERFFLQLCCFGSIVVVKPNLANSDGMPCEPRLQGVDLVPPVLIYVAGIKPEHGEENSGVPGAQVVRGLTVGGPGVGLEHFGNSGGHGPLYGGIFFTCEGLVGQVRMGVNKKHHPQRYAFLLSMQQRCNKSVYTKPSLSRSWMAAATSPYCIPRPRQISSGVHPRWPLM